MIPSWINKQTIAWAFYDFADTAFSALFITFFFPIFIKLHLGGNEFQIGLTMGLSVAVAALLVPFIGSLSDISGRRMPILISAAIATAAIVIVIGYTALYVALVLGFLARLTHLISKDVYDAKMTDIVARSNYGSVSGLGVSIGYFGTITSLAVGYILLSYFGWESIRGIQAMFWEAGIFYIIFSLPLFLLVKDKPLPFKATTLQLFRQGANTIIGTVKNLSRFPVFSRFLAASFFYNNAIGTVIIFLALYGIEVIDMSIKQYFPVFALMALTAAVGSFIVGRLSDKIGPIILIRVALVIWMGVVTLLTILPSYATFLAGGLIGGVALGAIWTLNRHVVAKVSPPEKIAEFFGFEGLTEKFSGIFGPIIFGYLVIISGYTAALTSMLVFFAIGLFLIRKINI